MASSSSSSASPHPKKNRKQPRKKAITALGDFFNEVASRPLGRRVLAIPQIQVEMEQPPYSIFTTSTLVPTFVSYQSTLDQFAEYSEYTSLFDQYRIDWVDVWLEPVAQMGSTAFGPLATAVDLDDANVPTSFSSVSAHPSSLVGMGGAGRHFGYRPRIAVAAYGGGVFTSYANSGGMWIDSASASVQQFGLKIAALATPVAVPYVLSARIIVTFRSPGI